MFWPLKGCVPMFPDEPGRFGVKRRYGYHSGIDLYCELGQEIIAIESGVVVGIEPFTGKLAESDWWNDTEAVLIKGNSGVFNYGEITPVVKIGDVIEAGQVIAVVNTAVLKRFKGRPTVMLHLELLEENQTTSSLWIEESRASRWMNDKCPKSLFNPEPILRTIAGDNLTEFDLSDYDGLSFRDMNASLYDQNNMNGQ